MLFFTSEMEISTFHDAGHDLNWALAWHTVNSALIMNYDELNRFTGSLTWHNASPQICYWGDYPRYTTLWRDHFGAACFVVALFGIAHVVAGPFWSGAFWCKFHEKIFSFAFCFNFLIYKKISVFLFSFFFQKQSKDFLFICNKFFPLYIKKYKFKHTTTIFLFGYSSNR